MRKIAIAVVCLLALAGCQGTPTPAAPGTSTGASTAVTLGESLLSVAAAKSTTVADVLAKGATICGKASSVQGQLLTDGLVMIANMAGVPTMVTGAAKETVADACTAIGLVPGPFPAGADPAAVPVQPVATTLPTV